jgi:hypothetical protein
VAPWIWEGQGGHAHRSSSPRPTACAPATHTQNKPASRRRRSRNPSLLVPRSPPLGLSLAAFRLCPPNPATAPYRDPYPYRTMPLYLPRSARPGPRPSHPVDCDSVLEQGRGRVTGEPGCPSRITPFHTRCPWGRQPVAGRHVAQSSMTAARATADQGKCGVARAPVSSKQEVIDKVQSWPSEKVNPHVHCFSLA